MRLPSTTVSDHVVCDCDRSGRGHPFGPAPCWMHLCRHVNHCSAPSPCRSSRWNAVHPCCRGSACPFRIRTSLAMLSLSPAHLENGHLGSGRLENGHLVNGHLENGHLSRPFHLGRLCLFRGHLVHRAHLEHRDLGHPSRPGRIALQSLCGHVQAVHGRHVPSPFVRHDRPSRPCCGHTHRICLANRFWIPGHWRCCRPEVRPPHLEDRGVH
mmetsp:Transcript_45073/g.119597  ORF Transcript_45073/g.119597 Transcript_45073/m.119597 type:complete len:212 (+) Transcript_45073:570-1205(+)